MKRDSGFSLVEQPLIAAGHKEPAASEPCARSSPFVETPSARVNIGFPAVQVDRRPAVGEDDEVEKAVAVHVRDDRAMSISRMA